MESRIDATASSRRRAVVVGRVVSAVPSLVMVATAALKLSHYELAVRNFVDEFGLSEGMLRPLGAIELACTALYWAPRTSTIGAALITAYLGGATVTELRASGNVVFPVAMGVLTWVGLALRDARVATALWPRSSGA